VPEDERKRYNFPSRACNVLTLTLLDRRPFKWIAGAKSVTGLTATITPFQLRFLGDMFDGLEAYDIPPGDDLMMDKIIVIGMSRTIPLSMYVENQWTFEKMFRFRETQAKAENDFEILRNAMGLIRLGYDKKKKYMTSGENERGEHKILQTYSFGSLGRGIDFAEHDLIDVNASIYNPVCAYVTDDPDTVASRWDICIIPQEPLIVAANVSAEQKRAA